MAVLMFVFAIVAGGMLVGWLAALMVARNERRNWGLLIVVGLGGSILGGVILSLVGGEQLEFGPAGVVGALVGAVIILAIYEPIRREMHHRRNVAAKEAAREAAAPHHQPQRKHPHRSKKH